MLNVVWSLALWRKALQPFWTLPTVHISCRSFEWADIGRFRLSEWQIPLRTEIFQLTSDRWFYNHCYVVSWCGQSMSSHQSDIPPNHGWMWLLHQSFRPYSQVNSRMLPRISNERELKEQYRVKQWVITTNDPHIEIFIAMCQTIALLYVLHLQAVHSKWAFNSDCHHCV